MKLQRNAFCFKRKTFFTLTALLTISPCLLAANGHEMVPRDASAGMTKAVAPADAIAADKTSTVPLAYEVYLLNEGKKVYDQLLRAREAALHKDKSGALQALNEVTRVLDNLQVPDEVREFDRQLGLIRRNLNDSAAKPDPDLWIPLATGLGKPFLFATDSLKAQAKASIDKGRQAAAANDRDTAKQALSELVVGSEYSFGVFPLTRVKEDVESAKRSLDLPTPYWAGVDEAVQSALETFHWFTQPNAEGWLAAYSDVMGAYAMATAPDFEASQQDVVFKQLIKAKKDLERVPGSEDLRKETQALIDEITPTPEEIEQLLSNIQKEIQKQREKSEKQASQ